MLNNDTFEILYFLGGGDVVALPCFITSSSMKLKKKDEIIKEHWRCMINNKCNYHKQRADHNTNTHVTIYNSIISILTFCFSLETLDIFNFLFKKR